MKPSLLHARSYFPSGCTGVRKAVVPWGCPPRELPPCCHFHLCLGTGFCTCCLQAVLCLWVDTVTLFVWRSPSCLDTVRDPATVSAQVDLPQRIPQSTPCVCSQKSLQESCRPALGPCSLKVVVKAVCVHRSAVQTLRQITIVKIECVVIGFN